MRSKVAEPEMSDQMLALGQQFADCRYIQRMPDGFLQTVTGAYNDKHIWEFLLQHPPGSKLVGSLVTDDSAEH